MVGRLIGGMLGIMLLMGVVIIGVTLFGVRQMEQMAISADPARMLFWGLVGIGGPILLTTIIGIAACTWLMKTVVGGDRKILATGTPGTAVIKAVRDTGATINTVNAVVALDLEVTIPGREAYVAEAQVMLNRMSWGALQPGMTVAVKVDPANPAKVAVDWSGQGAAATAGSVLTIPGLQGARRVDATRSADDIIAEGEAATAVILAVSDSGKTVVEMSPDSAARHPERADDPIVYVSMRVEPDGQPPFQSEGLFRAPRDRLADLSIGARVAVAFLPGDRASATLDWDRF